MRSCSCAQPGRRPAPAGVSAGPRPPGAGAERSRKRRPRRDPTETKCRPPAARRLAGPAPRPPLRRPPWPPRSCTRYLPSPPPAAPPGPRPTAGPPPPPPRPQFAGRKRVRPGPAAAPELWGRGSRPRGRSAEASDLLRRSQSARGEAVGAEPLAPPGGVRGRHGGAFLAVRRSALGRVCLRFWGGREEGCNCLPTLLLA